MRSDVWALIWYRDLGVSKNYGRLQKAGMCAWDDLCWFSSLSFGVWRTVILKLSGFFCTPFEPTWMLWGVSKNQKPLLRAPILRIIVSWSVFGPPSLKKRTARVYPYLEVQGIYSQTITVFITRAIPGQHYFRGFSVVSQYIYGLVVATLHLQLR